MGQSPNFNRKFILKSPLSRDGLILTESILIEHLVLVVAAMVVVLVVVDGCVGVSEYFGIKIGEAE